MYIITLIPGDGVGPEISEATKRVIEASGVPIKWDVQEAGLDVYEKQGTPLPQRVLDSIKKNKVAINYTFFSSEIKYPLFVRGAER